MKIFAHHAHVFPKELREDGTVEALLALMEECGIERAVAFAPFYEYFDQEFPVNQWLAGELLKHRELYGFGVIDFRKENLEEQVEEIARLGLLGIKIHPAFQKIKIDGEKAFRVYGEAQKHGLVLSFHTGVHWHRIAEYHTLLFDEVAWHFPKVRFTMEHVGGYSFFKEAVAVLVNNRETVYAGLTSVFDPVMNKFWYLGEEKVNELLWQIGAGRCVFGLDFPYNQAAEIKSAIRHVKNLNAAQEEIEGILGGNLEKLLGISDPCE